jgi:magnesium-transporting ATPase (P-type)
MLAYSIDFANDQKYKEGEKGFVFLMIFGFLMFEIILEIKRVDYQVLEIDNKIKNLIKKFQSEEKVEDWMNDWNPLSQTREFSYYQANCFTYAMRKGPNKFIEIPNNTLAEGDIIRLLPGDTAPAFVRLMPFNLEDTDEGVKIVQN